MFVSCSFYRKSIGKSEDMWYARLVQYDSLTRWLKISSTVFKCCTRPFKLPNPFKRVKGETLNWKRGGIFFGIFFGGGGIFFFGPLVPWSSGRLVPWSSGPLVLRSSGPPVLWSPGPPVLWSSGPLVLWSSSSTSSTSSSSRMWKQKTYWRI